MDAWPIPHRPGDTGPPEGGGDRPGPGGLPLGPRPCGTHDALSAAASPCPPSARRDVSTIGRAAASVWRHPRRREAAASNPPAASEAGARRTPVRWEPTHGYPPDHPS